MKHINVFVGGSIAGLEKQRNAISQEINKLNIANSRITHHIKDEVTFSVYDFSNIYKENSTQESNGDQEIINQLIAKEVDYAIFLFDGSKGGNCVGDLTQQEVNVVRENNIPYDVFLIYNKANTSDDYKSTVNEAKNRLLVKEDKKVVVDENQKFFHEIDVADKSLLVEKVKKRLETIIKRNVNVATWSNDNFAFYTIEARFNSTYDKFLYNNKVLADKLVEKDENGNVKKDEKGNVKPWQEKYGIKSYKEFMKDRIYMDAALDADMVKCKKDGCTQLYNRWVAARNGLLHITRKFPSITYGERHNAYLKTIPFLEAEFYLYYYILYKYLMTLNKYRMTLKNVKEEELKGEILDPYFTTKKEKLGKFVGGEDTSGYENLNNSFDAVMENPGQIEFYAFIKLCVNANSADLSQLSGRQIHSECKLVIDDRPDLWNYLCKNKQKSNLTAVCVTDNCGSELYSDILIGLLLLEKFGYKEVRYQVKELPIFVSDTIMTDVRRMINGWEEDGKKYSPMRHINSTLKGKDVGDKYVVELDGNKSLVFESHQEWHLPDLFNKTTRKLYGGEEKWNFERWNEEEVDLVIVKGDMNYRRLVGDRNYDIYDMLEEKVSYVTRPLLVLRSLKSNVFMAGSRAKDIQYVDPDWKISGKYGEIHFVMRPDNNDNANTDSQEPNSDLTPSDSGAKKEELR